MKSPNTHSTSPPEDEDVLSVIRQWESDVAEYRKQLRDFNEQMIAKINSKLGKIEHLRKLVPVVEAGSTNGIRARKKHSRGRARLTWSSGVLEIINQSERGLTYPEILERAIQTVLGKRRSEGDKGFYKALANLVANGEIVKSGKTVYSRSLAEALRARGEPLPDAESAPRGTKGLVIDLLGKSPSGLTGPNLKAALIADRNAPESIRKHDQYIYTVLKQLIDARSISKTEDGVYRLSK